MTVTQDQIRAVFGGEINSQILEASKVHEAISAVTGETNITRDEIIGHNRTRLVVLARQLCMWKAHSEGGVSFAGIGRIMKRDHATVMHGVRVTQKRIDAHIAAQSLHT